MNFTDGDLEKLYVYARKLQAKLPHEAQKPLSLDKDVVLRAYRNERIFEGQILAAVQEHAPSGIKGEGAAQRYDEERALSEIVNAWNERFQTDFTKDDELFYTGVMEAALKDDRIVEMARANTEENFAEAKLRPSSIRTGLLRHSAMDRCPWTTPWRSRSIGRSTTGAASRRRRRHPDRALTRRQAQTPRQHFTLPRAHPTDVPPLLGVAGPMTPTRVELPTPSRSLRTGTTPHPKRPRAHLTGPRPHRTGAGALPTTRRLSPESACVSSGGAAFPSEGRGRSSGGRAVASDSACVTSAGTASPSDSASRPSEVVAPPPDVLEASSASPSRPSASPSRPSAAPYRHAGFSRRLF